MARGTTRAAAALMAVACTLLLTASAAFAEPYGNGGGPRVTVSTTECPPGATVTISGAGFAPDSTASVSFGGDGLGTATADAEGAWAAVVTVPEGTGAGEHFFLIVGVALSGDDFSGRVWCAAPDVSRSAPRGLAVTGTDVSSAGAAAVALVAGGVLALAAGRRRARSASRADS